MTVACEAATASLLTSTAPIVRDSSINAASCTARDAAIVDHGAVLAAPVSANQWRIPMLSKAWPLAAQTCCRSWSLQLRVRSASCTAVAVAPDASTPPLSLSAAKAPAQWASAVAQTCSSQRKRLRAVATAGAPCTRHSFQMCSTRCVRSKATRRALQCSETDSVLTRDRQRRKIVPLTGLVAPPACIII